MCALDGYIIYMYLYTHMPPPPPLCCMCILWRCRKIANEQVLYAQTYNETRQTSKQIKMTRINYRKTRMNEMTKEGRRKRESKKEVNRDGTETNTKKKKKK